MTRLRCIAAAAMAAAAAGSPVAVAVAVAAPAARAVHGSGTSLVPRTGRIHTRFELSFTVPETTGSAGTYTRRDVLSIAGTRRARCVWRGALVLPDARQGTTERVTLTPSRMGGRAWCWGAFVGDVVQEEIQRCGPPQAAIMCPALVVRPQVIAQFSFRVKRG